MVILFLLYVDQPYPAREPHMVVFYDCHSCQVRYAPGERQRFGDIAGRANQVAYCGGCGIGQGS